MGRMGGGHRGYHGGGMRGGGMRGGGMRGGRMGGRHIGMRRGVHRARLGYHRVGFHSRMRYRCHHRRLLFRTYFRGRRIRYHWGPRHAYYPVPWYETPEFQTQVQGQGVPHVQSRMLTVTLVPYQATMAVMPPGVPPGGIFQFTHPGATERYLVCGPPNSQPGLQVQLMLPPPHLPRTADRTDVLTNLVANAPAAKATIDTDGDGVPDAVPFVPGQDGYITVMAVQGAADQLHVYVPATALLTLKHVVDAIDSWGESNLEQRHQNNDQILDTDFDVDLVQVGPEGAGPRWEHERFVDRSVPVAPRVVTVSVPATATPGSVFIVGTDITGAAEPLHVRVPEGMQPGQPLEVMVPEESAIPAAQQQVSSSDAPDPNAWAVPAGMDFYAQAQDANFQLQVGVIEVTVRAPVGGAQYVATGATAFAAGRCVMWVIIFLVVLGLIIGLSVGLSGPGYSRSGPTVSSSYCSTYYGYSPSCEECPTQPVGYSSRVCWTDFSVSWDWMEANLPATAIDAWEDLGYNEFDWDNANLPDAANMCYNDLSSTERQAAVTLGYTQATWNYPYRC